MTDQTKSDSVEKIISKIQEYASAWSLVGTRFDGGNALEDAEKSRDELHAMIRRALPPSATAQEAVAFRCRRSDYNDGEWDYVDGRPPDSYELRECEIQSLYTHTAPPSQPVSETAAQASVEFGEALDELIRANTAADADDRFGVERERRARANVERLYSLAAPVVPEGWALAPIEPTPEMIAAANKHEHRFSDVIYRAMLAAAPRSTETGR